MKLDKNINSIQAHEDGYITVNYQFDYYDADKGINLTCQIPVTESRKASFTDIDESSQRKFENVLRSIIEGLKQV